MISYTLDALRDIVRHQARLEQFSVRSASQFAARLALAETRIAQRPAMYRRLQDGETRRYGFAINRITYLIDYRIDGTGIVILRVWHGAQQRPQ